MSDRQIHINRAGQAYGPFPEAQASEMLASGQLLATDMAWFPGAAEWKPLGEVLGTATAASAAAPPPPPPATSADGGLKRQVAGSKPKEGEKKKEGESAAEGEEKDDPDKIHVTRKGEAIGPYPREKAKQYFIAGTLLPTDWGWHDGMGEDWKPLNEVLELPLPASAGGGTIAGGPWTIGGCFSEGWQTFKGNLGGAILFYFVASIVLFITAIIPLVNPFVLVPVMAGFMYYFIKLARREHAAIGDLFAGFKRGYGQLLLVCLLIGVIWMIANLPGVSVMIFSGAAFITELTGTIQDAMAGKIDDWEAAFEGIMTSFKAAGVGLLVGMILMMLLPVIALSFTVFSMPLVIDRQMKATDAIIASARLVKGQWFKTVFFLIVVSIVSGIGQLAFGIGVLFTAPIAMTAWASFYLKNASAITAEHTASVAKNMKIGLICGAVLPVGAAVAAVVMAGGSILGVAQAIDSNGTGAGNIETEVVGIYMWSNHPFGKVKNVVVMELNEGGAGSIGPPGAKRTQINWRTDPEKKEEVVWSVEGEDAGRMRSLPNQGMKLITLKNEPLPENQQIEVVKKESLVGQYVQGGSGGGSKGRLVLKKDQTAIWNVRGNAIHGKWYIYHNPGSIKGEVWFSGAALQFLFSINSEQKPVSLKSVARLVPDPAAKTVKRVPLPLQGQETYTKSKGEGVGPGGQQGVRPGMQQGVRPGPQQGVRPGPQQGVRPGGGQQGVRPGGQQGARPGGPAGGQLPPPQK